MCKFLRDKKKEHILQNRSKLRGTRIYIEQDFSDKVRHERQQLQSHMIEARNRGHVAYIQFKYLYVDRQRYRLSDLENSSNTNMQASPTEGVQRTDVLPAAPPSPSVEEALPAGNQTPNSPNMTSQPCANQGQDARNSISPALCASRPLSTRSKRQDQKVQKPH